MQKHLHNINHKEKTAMSLIFIIKNKILYLNQLYFPEITPCNNFLNKKISHLDNFKIVILTL